MLKLLKKILVFTISFALVFTILPSEFLEIFAAGSDIRVTNFNYIQQNNAGQTTVRVTIEGSNFRQALTGTSKVSVIEDIIVSAGAEPKSLMQNAKGVNIVVTDSLITITAPSTGELSTLNIDTNGESTIKINTIAGNNTSYEFKVKVNNLPTMAGSLDNK